MGFTAEDIVLTTPYTFAASAEVIRYFNATPLFVDVNPETLNIDPEKVDEKISEAGERRIMNNLNSFNPIARFAMHLRN